MSRNIESELKDIRTALERINQRLGTGFGERERERSPKLGSIPSSPAAFSLKGAAVQLGLGLSTVKELVRKQVILTVLVGRRRLVPHSEIAKFLQVSPDDRTRKVRRKSEGDKYRALLKTKRR